VTLTNSPVALYGADHTELDQVAVEAPGERVAIAITKGKHDKLYLYVDPNEDVVAAATGPGETLLVCADGHNGHESSHAAVRFLLDELSGPLEEDTLIDLFDRTHAAVLAKTRDCPNPGSRTTLAVGSIVGQRLTWASMGDSAVIRASSQDGETYWNPESFFVGWPGMTRTELESRLPRGTVDLVPGEWVVLATDGFTNFAWPDTPDEAVRAQLSSDVSPKQLARRLIDMAFEGGAGDNVAIAVFGPAH
jgi:serine/threonine protein phosphatase PrpC